MNELHEKYMKMALGFAERGRFSTSPNPMVGCVLVKNSRIISVGWHEKAGEPHAECMALLNAKESVMGATAYITLEPCSHTGRTPPCALRLIDAGIKTVYVATEDVNPLVNGRGIALLKAAGVNVHLGLCTKEARQQNRVFFHLIQHKTPYVIAKWAMSLDGKTSVDASDDRQLSSEASQVVTHDIRHAVDAILIGSHTAIHDNPLLTVRYQKTIYKHPIRLILCGAKTLLPFDLSILAPHMPAETWLIVPHTIDVGWYEAALNRRLTVICCDTDASGHIHLPSLMRYLGTKQVTSLLVEGGMTILQSFFAAQLVNESHLFLTPYVIGGSAKKSLAMVNHVETLGRDCYVTAMHEVRHV